MMVEENRNEKLCVGLAGEEVRTEGLLPCLAPTSLYISFACTLCINAG